MTEKIKGELEIIKQSILSAVPANAIYLFGSYAYGEPNRDSDLDIYVVVPEKEMCGTNVYCNIIIDIHKKISMPIDLLLREEKNFNERLRFPTLERKIYREGIKIYG